jgi:hypothetical protein
VEAGHLSRRDQHGRTHRIVGASTGRKRRFGLLAAATGGLLVAAWIGGDLVFRFGWRVRPAEEAEIAEQNEFMGVLVSSKLTQNGLVITGNIKQVVIVHNNPGYAPDPGHPPTGIVAIVCLS